MRTMPTAEARAHRSEVDSKLTRLRRQFLFLFIAGVVLALAFALYAQTNANRIEYGRYDACLARSLEINKFNAAIQPSGFIPPFPAPVCGQDPRTD